MMVHKPKKCPSCRACMEDACTHGTSPYGDPRLGALQETLECRQCGNLVSWLFRPPGVSKPHAGNVAPTEYMMGDLALEYHEIPADTVVRFYVDAFEGSVERHEWLYDPAKKMFVLKLYLRSAPVATAHLFEEEPQP